MRRVIQRRQAKNDAYFAIGHTFQICKAFYESSKFPEVFRLFQSSTDQKNLEFPNSPFKQEFTGLIDLFFRKIFVQAAAQPLTDALHPAAYRCLPDYLLDFRKKSVGGQQIKPLTFQTDVGHFLIKGQDHGIEFRMSIKIKTQEVDGIESLMRLCRSHSF